MASSLDTELFLEQLIANYKNIIENKNSIIEAQNLKIMNTIGELNKYLLMIIFLFIIFLILVYLLTKKDRNTKIEGSKSNLDQKNQKSQ